MTVYERVGICCDPTSSHTRAHWTLPPHTDTSVRTAALPPSRRGASGRDETVCQDPTVIGNGEGVNQTKRVIREGGVHAHAQLHPHPPRRTLPRAHSIDCFWRMVADLCRRQHTAHTAAPHLLDQMVGSAVHFFVVDISVSTPGPKPVASAIALDRTSTQSARRWRPIRKYLTTSTQSVNSLLLILSHFGTVPYAFRPLFPFYKPHFRSRLLDIAQKKCKI